MGNEDDAKSRNLSSSLRSEKSRLARDLRSVGRQVKHPVGHVCSRRNVVFMVMKRTRAGRSTLPLAICGMWDTVHSIGYGTVKA
jgi:hypothetical protein